MFSKIIKIPQKIHILNLKQNLLTLKGPKGSFPFFIPSDLLIEIDQTSIKLKVLKKEKKKILGLYSSLLKKNIIGLLLNFKKHLILNGVGYKVFKEEKNLILKLGYSHDIIIQIPEEIQVNILKNNQIICISNNWLKLTQFTYQIRQYKKPEIYKGKGILFKNEKILQKIGKKNKK